MNHSLTFRVCTILDLHVGDTFLAFKTKDHIHQFHNYVNVKHHSLKFTYDIENNDSLPFNWCACH